jgi:hypothetical protein
MGTRIVLEKSDDELRAVGAAIVLERLRERGRCSRLQLRQVQSAPHLKLRSSANSCSPPRTVEYRPDPSLKRYAVCRHFSAAEDLKNQPCQIPLPATSISPAPAISATSAAIPPKDGRLVRWRQIFRSNHLGHLTEADIEVLRRSAEERVRFSRHRGARCRHVRLAEIAVHSLPIEPTVVAALRARLAAVARRCRRPMRWR